jgi:hypothetical protein
VPAGVKLAIVVLLALVAMRVAPMAGFAPAHGLAAIAWAGAFLVWLAAAWPALSDPAARAHAERA